MRTPVGILSMHERSSARIIGVETFGCILALIVGAGVASSGKLVAGIVVGLVFCGIATAIYSRDPIRALIWLWVVEVFVPPLSAMFGYYSSAGEAIRQADEVLVLLFVVLTVWHAVRNKVQIPPLRFILPGIGVALFGLFGAVLHNVPVTVSVVGALLGLKLWIMVGITVVLPWKLGDSTRVYAAVMKVGFFVAVLGLLDYVTNAAVSRALHTSIYRFESEAFRGEAVHSIFPQPGEYSLFMSLLFALTFARVATTRKRSDLALALLFAGSVMLSLRLKGFLSLAAVAIIVALAQGVANNRGVTILLVGALLLVGLYSLEGSVIAKQVSTYASSETSIRRRLYATGERIARDDFPVGAGLGRFASYPSRIYYSPIYDEYGLSSVYGLSRAAPIDIDDTSWPSVIGETGYGGGAIYLTGVILLIFAIIHRLRRTTAAMKWVPLGALCAVAVVLVDSLGDPTLFDWLATTSVALVLGPAIIGSGPGSGGAVAMSAPEQR